MSGVPSAANAGDPSGILPAFLSLPSQLETAFERVASEASSLPTDAANLMFCGMGGSAAAGDVVIASSGSARLPMRSWRDYGLPSYCDQRSAVVALTYSGNTEEVLSAYDEARARGSWLAAVCSGGALAERGAADDVPLARVPADAPMPRAALGYLVGAALALVRGADASRDVTEAAGSLRGLTAELERDGGEAAALAEWVGDAVPVIWSSGPIGAAASWRWKSGFNENAKSPAFASLLPELNHHEVVGWRPGTGDRFRIVVLRHGSEEASLDRRLRATLEVISEAGLESREVRARGETALAQTLSLMLLGDVASALHALRRGIDPAPIEAISRVKARLAASGTA